MACRWSLKSSPLISQELLPDEVVSPGLMVISGQNFSPLIEENQVTVGAQPAVVISANPNQLLVTLDPNAQTGNTQCSVDVVPSGSPDLGLLGSHHAYVWEVVSQVWFWPRHILSQQTSEGIRNGLFPADAVAQLDQFGLTQVVGSTLVPPQAWAAMNYFPNGAVDAGIEAEVSGTGSSAGAGTTGGVANACAVGGTGGTGSAPADRDLGFRRRSRGHAQVGYADAGSAVTHWKFVPEREPPGLHKVQLNNPAGLSVTDQVTWLQGHLVAPAFTCYPSPVDWDQEGGLTPTSLLSTQGVGGLVGFGWVDAGRSSMIETVRFDPGGATEAPVLTAASRTPDNYKLLNAGRHVLYLGPSQPSDAGVTLSAIALDSALAEQLLSLDAGAGLVPVAVREPTLDDSTLWVALGSASTGPFEVTLVGVNQGDGGSFVAGTVSPFRIRRVGFPAHPVLAWWRRASPMMLSRSRSIVPWRGPRPCSRMGSCRRPVSTGASASNALLATWTMSTFLDENAEATSLNEPWSARLTDTSVSVLAPTAGGSNLYMSRCPPWPTTATRGSRFRTPTSKRRPPRPMAARWWV